MHELGIVVKVLEQVDALAGEIPEEPDYEETLSVPAEVLRQMIAALPEGYRTVFTLYCIEELSHQEIAALLNIEPHTSSSQLYRAKQMLRRWLRPIVLLLIAVALPLGVWRLWLAERNSTKEETSALYKGGIPKERSGVSVYQSHLPHQQRDEVVTPPYTPLLQGRGKTTDW